MATSNFEEDTDNNDVVEPPPVITETEQQPWEPIIESIIESVECVCG